VQAALDHFRPHRHRRHNAGILRDTIFHKMEIDDWLFRRQRSPQRQLFVSRAAAEHFRKQESGSIYNMSSTSA